MSDLKCQYIDTFLHDKLTRERADELNDTCLLANRIKARESKSYSERERKKK